MKDEIRIKKGTIKFLSVKDKDLREYLEKFMFLNNYLNKEIFKIEFLIEIEKFEGDIFLENKKVSKNKIIEYIRNFNY